MEGRTLGKTYTTNKMLFFFCESNILGCKRKKMCIYELTENKYIILVITKMYEIVANKRHFKAHPLIYLKLSVVWNLLFSY